jgi:hypothetical protein
MASYMPRTVASALTFAEEATRGKGKRAAAVAPRAPRDAAGGGRAVRGADTEAARHARFDASVAARGPHRSREARGAAGAARAETAACARADIAGWNGRRLRVSRSSATGVCAELAR